MLADAAGGSSGAGAGEEDEELPLSNPSSDDLEVYPDNSGEQDSGEGGLLEVRVGGGLRPEAGPTRLVDGGEALEYEVDCPVCLAPWTEDGPHQPCSLACGHTFGRMCLENWICKWKKNTCPKCKRQCDVDDIRPIYPPRVAVICKNSLKDSKLSSLQTTEYMELMQAIGGAVKMVEGLSQNLEEFKSQQEEKWAAMVEAQTKMMQEIDDIKMHQTRTVQTLLWEFRYMLRHGGLPIASSSNHALGDPASVSADLNEVPIHALGDSRSASAKMGEVFVHALGDSSSASANTDEVPIRPIGDSTSDGANMDDEPIHTHGNPASDGADMDDVPVPPTHPSDTVL